MTEFYSDQQSALITHGAGSGRQRIVVKAYAGSGKTHALCGLAHSEFKRGRKGLYLAYNKPAQMDASKRFGNSATCSTTHSLAYKATRAYQWQHKMTGITPMSVMQHCGFSAHVDWRLARRICDVIEKFLGSSESVIPSADVLVAKGWAFPEEAARIATSAKIYWINAIDPMHPAPISHDVYLKVYQLSKPVISAPFIMLDESQDTTDCVLDIISRQDCPVILVGDNYQSIYAYRGAINAMSKVQSDATFQFSESYRFGEKVAKIANTILWGFFSESTELVGCGHSTQIGLIPESIPHAYLSRGNAALFEQAVVALASGKPFGFVGGAKGYDFWSIVDTWYLQSGDIHLIRNQLIKGFENIAAMSEYAESADDRDLMRCIKIVATYGENVTLLVPEIYSKALEDLDKCTLILSTAHKSKGATLDCVVLADDFPALLDKEGEPLLPKHLDSQEVHLLYVAVTRARLALQLNETTWGFLKAMGVLRTQLETAVLLDLPPRMPFQKHAMKLAPIDSNQQDLF